MDTLCFDREPKPSKPLCDTSRRSMKYCGRVAVWPSIAFANKSPNSVRVCDRLLLITVTLTSSIVAK
jgi:hypothetical protein